MCQGPALTAMSVLSLFNVSMFVLCLSTWLCLLFCWPCAPLALPPGFQLLHPLFSPRLRDCVHLILVCSAPLNCAPFPHVSAGSLR